MTHILAVKHWLSNFSLKYILFAIYKIKLQIFSPSQHVQHGEGETLFTLFQALTIVSIN